MNSILASAASIRSRLSGRLSLVGVAALASIASIATLAVLVGCGSGGSEVLVTMQGNAYHPDAVTVSVGQTVKWVNKDQTAHSVMSDKFDNTPPKSVGPNEMASGPMGPGATYQITFTAPGTYKYHCMIHGYMHGTVIVQ